MKRIVSGLLALCLLCALPVTAAARGNPALFCRERDGGGERIRALPRCNDFEVA